MTLFSHRKQTGRNLNDASQVFRQFAWNIAGTLAQPGGKKTKAAPRRRAKTAGVKSTASK